MVSVAKKAPRRAAAQGAGRFCAHGSVVVVPAGTVDMATEDAGAGQEREQQAEADHADHGQHDEGQEDALDDVAAPAPAAAEDHEADQNGDGADRDGEDEATRAAVLGVLDVRHDEQRRHAEGAVEDERVPEGGECGPNGTSAANRAGGRRWQGSRYPGRRGSGS